MKGTLCRTILLEVGLYNLLMLSSSRYLVVYLRISSPDSEVHFILKLITQMHNSYPTILSLTVQHAREVLSTMTALNLRYLIIYFITTSPSQ